MTRALLVGEEPMASLPYTYVQAPPFDAVVIGSLPLSQALRLSDDRILQALAEQSRIVRLPLNQVSAVNKISKAITKFEQEFERKPSPEELAELVNEVPEKINDSLRASGRHVSVDAPFVEGEDNSPLDVMENTDSPAADYTLISESLQLEISRALDILNERERDIIEMSFGIAQPEMTLEEIGDRFGLTRERVRQIREKAIRKLRNANKTGILRSYLG